MVDTTDDSDGMGYERIKRLGRRNAGTVIRISDNDEERLYPAHHGTVTEAALWVRDDRPSGTSKYKTYIYRRLGDSHYGTSDGAYAETYCEAVEWIGDKSAEFDGERIDWLDRAKILIGSDDE